MNFRIYRLQVTSYTYDGRYVFGITYYRFSHYPQLDISFGKHLINFAWITGEVF